MITTGQLLLFFILVFHPVHVSVTSMEYNEGENIFLVSFKVFTDDFETIVEEKYGVNLNLGKEDELENADEYLKIPMYGFTESFNISVSAAIILHHLTSKLRNSNINWQLTDPEKEELKLNWLKKTVKSSSLLIDDFLSKKNNL